MPLRAYLSFLTLATLLPVAVFAAVLAYFLVQQDRETFRRGAEARALAMITAVDTALAGDIATLESLATTQALDSASLDAFRQRAERVLATRPYWSTINVALPSGQQVVNLLRPPGAPLPDIAQYDPLWPSAVERQRPFISDLVTGPTTGRWDYAVRVPVVRDGGVKYVLSAVVKPEAISALLARQNLPADWVAVVLDRSERIVARTVDAEGALGKFASASLREALARSPSGWFRGTTIEGSPVYTPYRRSDVSGWAFAMGIPAHAVDAIAWRAGTLFGISLLAALALAFLLARVVGRRIARPISALAGATEAIGRGERVEVPATRIAELRTLEDAVRSAAGAQKVLRDSDRAKDEFLAVLSHELRNPLAALSNAAHVLRVADGNGAIAAEARGVMERQLAHMAHLLDDLLDISRLTAGKITLEREPLDLAQAAAATVRAWRLTGRLREDVDLTLDTSPAWVDADPGRIEQVVANLLDNALKFTPAAGSVRVAVGSENGGVTLRVSNSGPGIAPEMLEHVFEPFRQGKDAKGGMGLGLALVKRLVELHGGTASAQSAGPGQGATFTVRLPAISERQAPAGETSGARHGAHRAAAPRRVLLIEDNADAREMLRQALEIAGHQVHAAPDGESGVAAAAQHDPDIALIDIGLPDMDGYEVARRLRSATAHARIRMVALTGYGQPGDEQRAREAGFDAHLTKPVPPERLQEMIAGL